MRRPLCLFSLWTLAACATPGASGVVASDAVAAPAVIRLAVQTEEIASADEYEPPSTILTLLEGDPAAPSRSTRIGDVVGNCGVREHLTSGDAHPEGTPRVLFVMDCWHAGMGRNVIIEQAGQTLTVETAMFWEEAESEEPPEVTRTLTVPPGARVEITVVQK